MRCHTYFGRNVSVKDRFFSLYIHFPPACPAGTFGPACASTCQCQNQAACHNVDGACTCTAGWKGTLCDTRKDFSRYGIADKCCMDVVVWQNLDHKLLKPTSGVAYNTHHGVF